MIELQHQWDMVLETRDQAERCSKSIRFWEQDINERKISLDRLAAEILNLKSTVKTKELDLSALDDRIRKQEERRNMLKSSREIDALENELLRCREDRSNLEDSMLTDLDNLERNEADFLKGKEDLKIRENKAKADIEDLCKRLESLQTKLQAVENDFHKQEENLSSPVRSRFSKQISSKGGKAVAELHGEVCGNCNTQIPPSLASDVKRGEGLIVCSNCGRYLYSSNK